MTNDSRPPDVRPRRRAVLDEKQCLSTARNIVQAKIQNQKEVLSRHYPEGPVDVPVRVFLKELDIALKSLAEAGELSEIQGADAYASRAYFAGLIVSLPGPMIRAFESKRRNQRPATDEVNALLACATSLLVSTWVQILEQAGWDPYTGFYHDSKDGCPALALDLMEAYRPLVCDVLVMGLFENEFHDLKPSESSGGIWLGPRTQRLVAEAFEQRLKEGFEHPVSKEWVTYYEAFEKQVVLFEGYLDGKHAEYRDIVWPIAEKSPKKPPHESDREP